MANEMAATRGRYYHFEAQVIIRLGAIVTSENRGP